MGVAPLIRELDRAQLLAVLRFLDAESYLGMLEKKLSGAPLRLPAPSAQVERDLQSLRQFAHEDQRNYAAASPSASAVAAHAVLLRHQALFGARLRPTALKAQATGDLLPLFDAASAAAAGNPGSAALEDMLSVHGELARRGIDTRRSLDESVLHAQLAARRFSQARAFATARPHLSRSPIPHVIESLGARFTGRSVLEFNAANDTLTRAAFPPPRGRELVMVVGAGCLNSTRALESIRDDPVLQDRLLDANIVLITAPDAPVDTRLMAEWNAAHPRLQIRAPYNAVEWKAIHVSGIPSFFLLENGQVIGKHTGWADDGKAELEKLIERGN